MIMDYYDFLESKKHSVVDGGFKPTFFPNIAFDFQSYIIEKAVKRGRMAVFADTGLGKTLIQLSIAENIVRHTNKKVLIITPLAVAFQFVKEAEKIGVGDIEQTKDGKFTKKIILCNYERLHYLKPDDFEAVILDESSILKNFKGQTKSAITAFIKKVRYRYLSTATPSPNDFIELGTSSEALGYMGYMDMLSKFFKNNQNSSDSNSRNIGDKYYLKPHAENSFFSWVNQWAIMVRKPSDLGFSDDRYKLPELINNKHTVRNTSLVNIDGQIQMYPPIAKSQSEVLHEQKQTINSRCEKAFELASGKTSVYWTNLNDEGAIINQLDPDAVQIKGSMSIDQKEDILLNFAEGNIERLITKAKMTGMGLNWQHCDHTVFFPTWSYEQYYQAIRRFWRFGQKNNVICDMVISEGQTRVIQALQEKTAKAQELYEKLTRNVNTSFVDKKKAFDKEVIKPKFLN